ncbi:hypothetical protein D1B31_11460 [Neobacillus notoginsengisoli]|uniref:Peptidase MA-like domain-containing protein n=1 Tax=Neobacillus notoginsengisoli TaxID=1578198 RepID=A0A417YUJ8_9BACI|nr:hypothetical protein [Neobacillus notoginsengisoli]RHW40798.1 hypothetical protein D1B31_11460 [Neobacillus notoginsengisoli]
MLIFGILLSLIVAGCSHEQVNEKPFHVPVKTENNKNVVVTDDGKITFKIYNTAKVPDAQVEALKKEISNAYNVIQKSIKTDYVPSERIDIFLLEGSKPSAGFRNKIELYGVRTGKHPLVHELTHSIQGYGENFDSTSRGYLTQEGFAEYMEQTYGQQKYPINKMMKYFMVKSRIIPLSKLTNLEEDDKLFRPPGTDPKEISIQIMSYYHAASFVTYLIDQYGLDAFEKIYNQDNLPERMQAVYGKSLNELEGEWLANIEENFSEPDMAEKMKIDQFYFLESTVDSLDQGIFKRD